MGYCTNYRLIVSEKEEPLIEELRNECEWAKYALDEIGETTDACKWYEHEEDLKVFSLKHPDTLFQLEGEGEESDDIWIKYFKNGKIQKCYANITFDEYDESKLE